MPIKRDPQRLFTFEWVPGAGPSPSALANLQEFFQQRPHDPPGEAWFMSLERKYHNEFVETPMEQVSLEVIQHFLFDMTSGLDCFPEAKEEIGTWTSWFKYMMPFLVCRAHETCASFAIESLITTFMRVYGSSIDDQYSGFRIDALQSVGQALMKPEFWNNDGDTIATCWQSWLTCKGEPQLMPYCSGAISSAMFFNLMYLPTSNIDPWVRSVLAIKSVYFRAHLLVWLAAAYELLVEKKFGFYLLDQARFNIDWDSSFLLGKTDPPISKESIERFFIAIRSSLKIETLLGWVDQFSTVNELSALLSINSIPEYVADVVLVGMN